MKRLALGFVAVVLAFSFTGCAGATSVNDDGSVPGGHHEIYGNVQKVIVDGTECVLYERADSRGGGAISCDWNTP